MASSKSTASSKFAGTTQASSKSGGTTQAFSKSGGAVQASSKYGGATQTSSKSGGPAQASSKSGGTTQASSKSGGATPASSKSGGAVQVSSKYGGATQTSSKYGGPAQASSKSDGTTQASSKYGDATQASVQAKDVRGRQRLISIQMVQNILLIWLDNNIDDTSDDCRNTLMQLRRAVNTIHTYRDGNECIQFLETIQNEKACMIISGSLGREIVPRVHDVSQVDSIFIFCSNQSYHEEWTKDWPKIKGVFTDIKLICEGLNKAAQQCEQDSMPISIVSTSDDISQKNLNQLPPSFMYTQILKEILLSIHFKQQHINEFIQYCRDALADNENELENVNKFKREYGDQTPIWWYTYECFLYPMLNRALRTMDANLITTMGFFINDLHRHIEQLHKEQFDDHNSNKSFIIYRGQGVSEEDFKQMSETEGGLIAFNNFLSTSKKSDVSLRFARNAMMKPGMVGILFVMNIDPAKSTTPFASITGVSYFEDSEDEVLFSMQTVFRIGEITPMGGGNTRLFQVNLILTSDNDKDLRVLTRRIREETFPGSKGWFRLGLLLWKMGQFAKAQHVYEILLEQTTVEIEKGMIYSHLGSAYKDKGDYQEAIKFYEKSLEIDKKILPPNHPNLAVSYGNIGLVHKNMGDYPKALLCQEKALAIQQQSLRPDHPDLAASYNNIGVVYKNMGNYPKALWYYEKDLEISKKSLPLNHPDLAKSYGNIGLVHERMDDYPEALSFYEKALAIQQQSLPPNHPDFALCYNNIGLVHEKMGDYPKACSFFERAVNIGQQSFSPNNLWLQSMKSHLERVKEKL